MTQSYKNASLSLHFLSFYLLSYLEFFMENIFRYSFLFLYLHCVIKIKISN